MRALRNPSHQSALTSIAALLAASALAFVVFGPPHWPGQVASRSPDGSPRVAEGTASLPRGGRAGGRVAVERPGVAGAIALAEGDRGLRAMDLFGDEAIELFEEDPDGFRDLATLATLDRPLIEASAGPWREAVFQWARAGTLAPYRAHLARLDADQQAILAGTPGCLPLLGRGAPTVEAMLARHGQRAWGLFLGLDCAEDVAGVERVAGALATFGDRMLRVNESHGPALSLLFVAPREDASGRLPHLFAQAIDRLGVEEAGALFLANYEDLTRLVLEEGHDPEEVVGAFDLLAGQPEEVRALASDSGRVLRLLLERRGEDPIGVEILSRCGPEAADLLFEQGGYASHAGEKAAALAILARRGWPGVELLRVYRDDEKWHRLIRRTDLLDSDDEPLLVRMAGKLESSQTRQDDIERFLDMPRGQILDLELPATPAEAAVEWVPGYLAVHTTYQAARGYRVENSEIALALFDGVTTVTFVGKLVGQAVKTVGRQAPKVAFDQVGRQATAEFGKSAGPKAGRTLLTRLPGSLPSMTRELPGHLPTLDFTSVIRSGSAVASKLGLRTWGKLDRRIIMRGDRKVIVDLSDPNVISHVESKMRDDFVSGLREEVIKSLNWGEISRTVGVFGPCVMERVHPALVVATGDASGRASGRTSLQGTVADPPRGVPGKLSEHPAYTCVGLALITICLGLAVPRFRGALGRRLGRVSEKAAGRPRRFLE